MVSDRLIRMLKDVCFFCFLRFRFQTAWSEFRRTTNILESRFCCSSFRSRVLQHLCRYAEPTIWRKTFLSQILAYRVFQRILLDAIYIFYIIIFVIFQSKICILLPYDSSYFGWCSAVQDRNKPSSDASVTGITRNGVTMWFCLVAVRSADCQPLLRLRPLSSCNAISTASKVEQHGPSSDIKTL